MVEAGDRHGLLRDLSEVFSREKINVTAVNTLSKQHLARMGFTLEVRSVAELKRTLALLADVPGGARGGASLVAPPSGRGVHPGRQALSPIG